MCWISHMRSQHYHRKWGGIRFFFLWKASAGPQPWSNQPGAVEASLAESTSLWLWLGCTRCRRKKGRKQGKESRLCYHHWNWNMHETLFTHKLLPCFSPSVFWVASSLAFLASSRAASLASCTSFSAFHSFLLFSRRSSIGVISTWKRLNSWGAG